MVCHLSTPSATYWLITLKPWGVGQNEEKSTSVLIYVEIYLAESWISRGGISFQHSVSSNKKNVLRSGWESGCQDGVGYVVQCLCNHDGTGAENTTRCLSLEKNPGISAYLECHDQKFQFTATNNFNQSIGVHIQTRLIRTAGALLSCESHGRMTE